MEQSSWMGVVATRVINWTPDVSLDRKLNKLTKELKSKFFACDRLGTDGQSVASLMG